MPCGCGKKREERAKIRAEARAAAAEKRAARLVKQEAVKADAKAA